MSFGCRGARSRAGAGAGGKARPSLDGPCSALPHPAADGPILPSVRRDVRPVRDTRPVYVTGRGQWAYRQMALRTRSRSTCLRATSKGSTAPIAQASHAPAPSVHPAPVIGAAGRGTRSCGFTSAQTPASAGLIPLRWKTPKTLPARDALGSAGLGRPTGLLACSAPVSPCGSRPSAQPWRIQATGGSALWVSRGGRCWQSHQVPPGQSS